MKHDAERQRRLDGQFRELGLGSPAPGWCWVPRVEGVGRDPHGEIAAGYERAVELNPNLGQAKNNLVPALVVWGSKDRVFPVSQAAVLAASFRHANVVVLEGAGLARVDFLLERSTNRFFINEVNSIPGFTSKSMYPLLWESSGVSYPALLDRLIELALERHRVTNALETRYSGD